MTKTFSLYICRSDQRMYIYIILGEPNSEPLSDGELPNKNTFLFSSFSVTCYKRAIFTHAISDSFQNKYQDLPNFLKNVFIEISNAFFRVMSDVVMMALHEHMYVTCVNVITALCCVRMSLFVNEILCLYPSKTLIL